jgi:hypothetical protein
MTSIKSKPEGQPKLDMSTPASKPYYVTVLFRQGYGDHFATADEALEYAEMEIHRLLAEHEELECEPFEGVYCQREDTGEVWRFEYNEDENASWVREEEESARRSGPSATILPFRRSHSK